MESLPLNETFRQLAIALGLGLLVGLQRERAATPMAGLRTFSLVTVLGAVCALLATTLGVWIVAAGLVAVAALLVVSNLVDSRNRPVDPGLTTEVAALLMYALGALVVVGPEPVVVALGAGTAVLLHFKGELHRWAGRLGDQDLHAIFRFALVALVIWPVLPDAVYGPYQVLNPRQIWLMVVLIVGIGLGGYVAIKVLGRRGGTLLGGVLGGLVSSTATTVSFARRSARSTGAVGASAIVIAVSSTVVFARVLVEIAVVAPAQLRALAPPLAVTGLVLVAASLVLWLTSRAEVDSLPEPSNPTELRSALVFAGLYALVLLAVAAAEAHLGPEALYGVAVVSGLTDVDAITLSTAQLTRTGRLEAATAWRLILVAVLANLVFKGVLVAVLGHRRLARRIAVVVAVAVAAGGLVLALWP